MPELKNSDFNCSIPVEDRVRELEMLIIMHKEYLEKYQTELMAIKRKLEQLNV